MKKEKNLLKAMNLIEQDDFDPKSLSMAEIADLMTELAQADAAFKSQDALVKKHHNEVYGPMCEIKAELDIKLRLLELKIERIREVNPVFAAMEKLVKRARNT